MSVIVKPIITYTPTQGRGYYEETPQQKLPRQRRGGFWPLQGGRAWTRQAPLLLVLMCLCYGCSLGQEWSENYALLPGVTASDPSFIDGKPETIGESQRKKGSGSAATDLNIPSEAIIYLPAKKSLYRIVIHSRNLEEFELMAFNTRGKWDKIYDQRSNKEPVIDIRLNKAVTTTGIKLVVHRTTEDAARRRENGPDQA